MEAALFGPVQTRSPAVPIEQGQGEARIINRFFPEFYLKSPTLGATFSALLGQRRGDPFSGATHRQASIARSRRIKWSAFLVALVSFSIRSITQARMGP